MPDREKVMKGLECCLGSNDCDVEPKEDCPYKGMCLCAMALHLDVLALLKEQEDDIQDLRRENHNILTQFHKWAKEQEAVEPITDNNDGYWCGSCHEDIVWHQRFCSNCGRAVKWDS